MKYGFLLSMGRTGTQLISRLVKMDPNVASYHEPYDRDPEIMQLRYSGFHTVADGCMAERMEEMTRRSQGHTLHIESNSYLRFEAEWLRRELDANMVFLSRDARTFLPSAYQRNVYTDRDQQFAQVPHDTDRWAEQWSSFNRFEKICWYWDYANRYLYEQLGPPVHIERVTDSFESFRTKLLDPLGVSISKEDWEKGMSVKVNHSTRYRFRKKWRNRLGFEKTNLETLPPYSQWTDMMKQQFDRICGDTQERLGYER